MTLKDRLRRLRKHSTSHPAASTNASPKPTPQTSSPANISPGTRSTNLSTPGQATPAATQTPTAGISSADLTTTLTSPDSNASTLQEMLLQRAATNASLANGDKKKRRGLFRKKEDPYKDWPEDVYKPNEVPPPKYKRTPDPKHLENLHAFSFGGGVGAGFGGLVRRFSQQSGVSPGGSKWTSPFGSRVGSRAPSRLASANPSRNPSIAEDVDEDDRAAGDKKANGVGSPGKLAKPTLGRGVTPKSLGRGLGTMQAHDVDRVTEEEGEGDVGNGE